VTSTANYDMGLRPTTMRRSLFGIITLLFIGCGGGGSTCGPSTDITGTWSGPVLQDDVSRGNPGTVDATILQSGCDLGGSWNFTFQSPTLNKNFKITGSAPETTNVQLTLLECIDPNCFSITTCEYQVTGTLVSPTEISGTYATESNCSSTQSGSFDMSLRTRLTPTPVSAATGTPPSPTPIPTP
jgi:hypothetical protein